MIPVKPLLSAAAEHGRMRLAHSLLVPCLLAALAPIARAQPEAPIAEGARYLLGVALLEGPEYAGSDRRELKLRPLWAYQHGRFRISTSRANGLLGFGSEASGPGASADLLSSERFKLGVALRIDSGRSSGDSPRLAGLPDIKRTLRGRIYAAYSFDKHWSVSASLSPDLLGRKGGTLGGLDLGYRARLGTDTEWTAGAGLSFGDRQNMRSYFGVSEAASAQSGLPVFAPRSLARDLHAGLGLTTALDRHWLGFAGLGVSTLLADAADSPLTHKKSSVSGSLGVVYRWLP